MNRTIATLRRVEKFCELYENSTMWNGEPAIVDRAFGQALRMVLEGNDPMKLK